MANPVAELNMQDQGAVLQAIATFEGILEVFPEDVGALESLVIAYEQAGDTTKANEKAMLLAELLSEQQDWSKLNEICRHILAINPQNERAKNLLEKAQKEIGGNERGNGTAQTGNKPATGIKKGRVSLALDLSGELEMAWFMLQKSQITQEQYEAAVSGLTETRMNPATESTLSILHELAGMERIHMDRILGFLSAETMTPFIEVSRFEIDPDVAKRIPLNDAKRLGVLAFEHIRDEMMVAMLNPVDENLRKTLTEYLNCKIHFYLTSPEELQTALTGLETAQPGA